MLHKHNLMILISSFFCEWTFQVFRQQDSTVLNIFAVGSTEETGRDPVFQALGHCSFNRVWCFRRCHIRTKVSAGDVQVQHLGIRDPGDILNHINSNTLKYIHRIMLSTCVNIFAVWQERIQSWFLCRLIQVQRRSCHRRLGLCCFCGTQIIHFLGYPHFRKPLI